MVLTDFRKTGLDYPIVSNVSTCSYTRKAPMRVKRFLMVYTEGVQRLFKNKKLATKFISKCPRT